MIVQLSNQAKMTIKEVKTNFIVDTAVQLILEKSISEVTVKDIAKKAGVGEATVYRYFSTKQNLVGAVAVRLEKDIFENYFATIKGDGYQKLAQFYKSYYLIFSAHKEFFKFINEFDAFMLNVGTSEEYATGLDTFKKVFTDAYTQAAMEGSITPVDNPEVFYYATTHALLELCKKLSSPEIVRQDLNINKEKEILTLTDIILHRLKKA